jgi:class 3 adenylate cyclase
MDVRLLGPVEAIDDAGRPLELRRQKQRALLAALALRPGQVVSTDRLLEDLWGAEPPRTAVGSLQNLVSHLRKVLGRDVVVTRSPGYVLVLDAAQTDVGRFEALVARAQAAAGEDRAAALRKALALWRGPALADVAFEPFAGSEVARLDELRVAVREELVAAELARGRHAAVIGELETLVAEHPLRERPRALLMLALYRADRQAEALEAYAEARRYLRVELGLDPSQALQKLQQGILRQDPALDAPAAAPLPGVPGEEHRATVTVLFADVVDSTTLGAGLDPEAYRSVLRRYYRTAREVLERHGGTVEKFIGDAVVAVFGVPQRHEDDALRAVRAAVELQESVAELNDELERVHGVAIGIRIGVNTGEAIAGEAESGESFATGYAVNVAAKLQQAAPSGGVLIGAPTYRLVRDAVAAEAVEPLSIGRAATPLPAFRVASLTGAPGIARYFGAPLVGREEELASLRTAFGDAYAAADCRLVTVLGEAGIGKTRLANELAASVGDEARVLVGRCVSYGEGATYLPIVEVVRAVAPDLSEAGIAALLPDDADARLVARRVRELLGLAEGAPPPGEGLWAVRRLLEALARERPLLLLLEDIHWAEPTLLDLVEHLVAQSHEVPILVLCLARPDVLEARPDWPVLLRLEPLSDDASAELVAGLPGGGDMPEDVRGRIVEAAEGNALFAEQLLAHVLESGESALDEVPGSVEALLASRLDRLPANERGVLERAAVVGREFSRDAVKELSERDVAEELDALTAKGLVRAARRAVATMRFHHVLIRDVAYAGITKERRSKLHERVAAWLDSSDGGRDELVGYHLEQGYRYRTDLGPTDDAVREIGRTAGERLGAAGIQAWKRADTPAAVNLLGRATALPLDRERAADLLCELANAAITTGDGERGRAALEQALELAAKASSRRVELRARVELAHAGMHRISGLRATADDVVAAAAAAIPVLEELEDDRALGRVWMLVGDAHSLRLDSTAWGEAAETAFVYYRRAGWSPALCLRVRAASLFHGPTPAADAIERCSELVDDAEGDRHAVASVRVFVAGLMAMQMRFDEAHAVLEQARQTFDEQGARFSLAGPYSGVRAGIELLAGNRAAAEATLRDSYAELEAMGQSAFVATRAAGLADVLCDAGALDEAERLAERALQSGMADDVISEVRWRSVRARVLTRRGARGEAEALARQSVALIEESDLLNDRAKALLDLADVLGLIGRSQPEANRVTADAIDLYREKGNAAAVEHVAAARQDRKPLSGRSVRARR